MKLLVIIASTRPGRAGGEVGAWAADYARAHSAFDVDVADLEQFALPLFDEPGHPMRGDYVHAHTKAWSAAVASAAAFIVVMPEYNFTMPPSLLNSIDYLHHEWNRKPVGLVGYGIVGGARAIQTARTLFSSLNSMPVGPAVTLSGVYAPLAGPIDPPERQLTQAGRMMAEIEYWAGLHKAERD